MGACAFVPHEGDALLLATVTQVDDYRTLGTARVRNPNPFSDVRVCRTSLGLGY